MAIENIQEIQNYIKANESNEEVKQFVQGLNPITLDKIKTFVGTDKDAKSWFDSERDTHAEKVKKTFQEKDMQKLINEEIKKRYPEADPKDIELNKVKAEVEEMKKENLRKELTNKALKLAAEKGLSTELIDFMVADSEENTIKNIELLEKVFNSTIEKMVEERLKSSPKPPTNNKNESKSTGSFLDTIKQVQRR